MLKNKILISFLFQVLVINSFSSIMVINGLTHETQLAPGEKYKGTIQLLNTSKRIAYCRIYQTDYSFKFTEYSQYDEPGKEKRSNSEWIKISTNTIALESNVNTSLNFEVDIPNNNSLIGTYWSVIMIEGIDSPDTSFNKKSLVVNSTIRYAIQIITHIGDTGTRELSFLNVDLLKDQENLELHIDIENTGERALRPRVSVELFSNENVSLGIFMTDPKRIYPGCSARFKIPIEAIKPGKYKGVLVADCEDDHVFGSNVEIEI